MGARMQYTTDHLGNWVKWEDIQHLFATSRPESQFAMGDPHPLDVARFDCHYNGDWTKCDKEMCHRESICRRRS